jgi:hypothetical protein
MLTTGLIALGTLVLIAILLINIAGHGGGASLRRASALSKFANNGL